MIPPISKTSIGLLSLFCIVFIEGFVSVSVEILTIRQLIPVVGNSVIVTSIIIGMFLLFLALGYYRGGFYRDNYEKILRRNFANSGVILGVGLCYFTVSVFFHYFSVISHNSLVALVAYLLLVTAPLIYFLGQTVPITTNLFRFERHVGAVSGQALFISTLGSFLGAVVTALVLMHFLGVAWTVMINYIAIFALMLLVTESFSENLWQIALMLIFGVFIYIINVQLESTVFVRTNEYANYQILNYESLEHGKGRILSSNESASSFLREDKSSLWYIEEIKEVLFKEMGLTDKDILVLGSGGFTITAQGDYGNRVVYNDIDGEIEQIALNGFIDKVNGEFVVDDARRLLRETKKKYDVIISDAYTNRISIPAHLLTLEYMQSVRNALKPGGLAIFNTIMKATLQETFAKRLDNTIRAVFPSCNVVPYRYNTQIENVLYFCTLSEFENDKTVYTDNKNTASLDFFAR